MNDIRRILVPLDFSEGSRLALRHAVALARRLGAEVHALHVWEPSPVVAPDHVSWLGGSADTFWTNLSADLEKRLRALIAEEIPDAAASTSVEVDAGYVAHTLLRSIDQGQVALLVMGTHGRTGLSHVLMGSVAERLVRLSPVPVMTIRATRRSRKARHEEPTAEAAESPSKASAAPPTN
ncbi:MAG: universal stress protein [Deltaproteobacteria bacterium]|nr:universal stress protein [Deltaproteobacteria bacterium]